MRLLDRVAGRYRQQGYYEGMASGAAVLVNFGTDSKREGASQSLIADARQAYLTNGVVFAVTLARMTLLSEATFKLREKTTKQLYGAEDVLRGRRVDLGVLEVPWPNGTTGDLWARTELDTSTAGNSYWWKAEPDLLVNLPPDEVTIVSEEVTGPNGRYKRVIGYDWDPSKQQPASIGARADAQFFTVDEVAHCAPIPDPNARWRGMSWLTPVLREVGADSGLTNYKTQYLDHGSPITAIKYPVKLRQDTVDSIVARIQSKYGGVGNAFKPLVLDQGADPTVGAGLRDLDYAAVQAIGEARICSAGQVPPVIIGLRSGDPAESDQAAMRRFADLYARPAWRRGCAAFEKLITLPPKGVQLWFDTSDIAALQAAETERAQVTQVNAAAALTLIQAGFTRESVVSAVTSGDLGLLKPDPDAPTPGVSAREAITAREDVQPGTEVSALGKTGVPPGGPQALLTKPQTAASKMPMPASFPTAPSANGAGAARPSPNK